MRTANFVKLWVQLGLISISCQAAETKPACEGVASLKAGIECIQANEPSFRKSGAGPKERELLRESAYRLINPDLELEYSEGRFLGDIRREMSGSLLFNLELGGKRSARARALDADGMELEADAFEQRIRALSELGGALIRLHQLEDEAGAIQESASTFRKVIQIYRSRGELPPEQRVSLNTFELVVLEYERKLLEARAEQKRVEAKVEALFGPSRGVSFTPQDALIQAQAWRDRMEDWLDRTPEMLRTRAKRTRAEGNAALARAEAWPDLRLGPKISQATEGPFSYQTYGFQVSFPIPILNWNGNQRGSTSLTEERVQAENRWSEIDVRSLYLSKITEMERIGVLLREAPSEDDIRKKHASTERLFDRGLVSGALMIEAHRALVEHYENRHALERELLEWSLKFDLLSRKDGST